MKKIIFVVCILFTFFSCGEEENQGDKELADVTDSVKTADYEISCRYDAYSGCSSLSDFIANKTPIHAWAKTNAKNCNGISYVEIKPTNAWFEVTLKFKMDKGYSDRNGSIGFRLEDWKTRDDGLYQKEYSYLHKENGKWVATSSKRAIYEQPTYYWVISSEDIAPLAEIIEHNELGDGIESLKLRFNNITASMLFSVDGGNNNMLGANFFIYDLTVESLEKSHIGYTDTNGNAHFLADCIGFQSPICYTANGKTKSIAIIPSNHPMASPIKIAKATNGGGAC